MKTTTMDVHVLSMWMMTCLHLREWWQGQMAMANDNRGEQCGVIMSTHCSETTTTNQPTVVAAATVLEWNCCSLSLVLFHRKGRQRAHATTAALAAEARRVWFHCIMASKSTEILKRSCRRCDLLALLVDSFAGRRSSRAGVASVNVVPS
jgi:hypothetical protein